MTETVHRLMTIGRFWDAVQSGDKNFEVRLNDRGFQTGDILELVRLRNDGEVDLQYFGRDTPPDAKMLRMRVTFLLQGGQFGLDPLWCVMSLEPAQNPSS